MQAQAVDLVRIFGSRLAALTLGATKPQQP